ncbi:MAG: type II secretion system protein N [Maricaulaceae bacterium]
MVRSAWLGGLDRFAKPTKPTVLFTELVLVAGLAVGCVQLLWAVSAPPAPESLRARAAIPAPARLNPTRPVDLTLLQTSNPFHASARATPDNRVGAEGFVPGGADADGDLGLDAPETSLALKLTGVRASVSAPSSAVIAVGDEPDARFKPGDTLLDGVVLRRILPDRVILSRNGALERLSLPEARINAGAAVIDDGVATADPPQPNVFTASAVNAGSTELEPSAVSQAGDTSAAPVPEPGFAIADADALFSVLDLRERRENGQLIGYEARAQGGRTAELRRVGFRPGDVVTAVNGVRLNRTENLARLEGVLAQARTARITVQRDGATEVLRVRLSGEG